MILQTEVGRKRIQVVVESRRLAVGYVKVAQGVTGALYKMEGCAYYKSAVTGGNIVKKAAMQAGECKEALEGYSYAL